MILLRWLGAFLLTLAIEAPLVLAVLRREPGAPELPTRRALLGIFFANLATHPLVWFGFPQLGISPNVDLAISEVFAPVAEAAFFATMFDGVTLRRAGLAAVAANLTSFGLGLLLFLALGW